ncbi:MAG TPA: hypothetical protein VGL06_16135 [Pseudonocardiaceae bacterium]
MRSRLRFLLRRRALLAGWVRRIGGRDGGCRDRGAVRARAGVQVITDLRAGTVVVFSPYVLHRRTGDQADGVARDR